MGTVNPTQSSPGDTIEASDVNTPVNQIAAVINGGIETVNLADDAVTTAKIAAGAVTAAKMQYGLVRHRQGGTTGDGSWATAGTSNTDTSAKSVFMQTGTVTTNSGSDLTVTFPTAFSQKPQVFVNIAGDTTISANGYAEIVSRSTTTTVIRAFNTAGAQIAESVNWLAIGQ